MSWVALWLYRTFYSLDWTLKKMKWNLMLVAYLIFNNSKYRISFSVLYVNCDSSRSANRVLYSFTNSSLLPYTFTSIEIISHVLRLFDVFAEKAYSIKTIEKKFCLPETIKLIFNIGLTQWYFSAYSSKTLFSYCHCNCKHLHWAQRKTLTDL